MVSALINSVSVWCVTASRIWTLVLLLNQQHRLKWLEPLIPGALLWPCLWEGSSLCTVAVLSPPYMDMDGKPCTGCIRDKGQTLHWGGMLPPYGAFTSDRKSVILCWEANSVTVPETPVDAKLCKILHINTVDVQKYDVKFHVRISFTCIQYV